MDRKIILAVVLVAVLGAALLLYFKPWKMQGDGFGVGSFRDIPFYDAHMHFTWSTRDAEFMQIMDEGKIQKGVLLSTDRIFQAVLGSSYFTNDAQSFYMKFRHPGRFWAFSGINLMFTAYRRAILSGIRKATRRGSRT